MIKGLLSLLLILSLAVPVQALELTAPEVPESGRDIMPEKTGSFPDALGELLRKSLELLHPDFTEAAQIGFGILFSAMIFSLIPLFARRTQSAVNVTAAAAISSMMFQHTNSMIVCASDTVMEICEYGKLLCPVMTAALAAQGGVTGSSALYMGTTAFVTLLSMLVSRVIIPMIYLFLAFSVAYCALEEEVMKKFAEAMKNVLSWLLKTLLIIFTAYMSITGVISGTTDAAALKTAKLAISTAVPVVGGILSDASESLLVSMAMVKNAAGIYGILAVLAVFMGPFLKIGVQYLLLKATSLICSFFADKNISALLEHFSSAMGILLATVAAGCVMVLFSTVCYMKGLG